MNIRTLTEADAQAYRLLRLRAVREDADAFGSSYADEAPRPLEHTIERLRAQAASADFTLGAFEDERLVGIVTFVREPGEKVRHKAHVYGMYVAPEVRGCGYGRALLTALLARARNLTGLTQVQLSVVTRKTAARSLYLSLGFRPWGIEREALKLGDEYLDEEYLVLFLPRQANAT